MQETGSCYDIRTILRSSNCQPVPRSSHRATVPSPSALGHVAGRPSQATAAAPQPPRTPQAPSRRRSPTRTHPKGSRSSPPTAKGLRGEGLKHSTQRDAQRRGHGLRGAGRAAWLPAPCSWVLSHGSTHGALCERAGSGSRAWTPVCVAGGWEAC